MTTDVDTARARYFAWKRGHPAQADDPATVWAAAWQAGAWNAIRQNATLGLNLVQIIQRLEELAALYADVDNDRHVEAELEAAAKYWRSDA